MKAGHHEHGAPSGALAYESRGRALRLSRVGRLFAPLLTAYATATLVALIDTAAFIRPRAHHVECFAAAVAAWAVPSALLAVLAMIVRAVVGRFPSLRALFFPEADRLPGYLVAIALAAFGAVFIDWAFYFLSFGNEVTQRFGLVGAAFGYVLLAGLSFRPLSRAAAFIVGRLPRRVRDGSSFFLTVLVLTCVVGFVLGRFIEPDYYREVGWETPVAVMAVFVAALIGTVAPSSVSYLAAAITGVGLSAIIFHHSTEALPSVTTAVSRHGRITPTLTSWMTPPRARTGPESPSGVQACTPEETMSPLGSLGDLPPDAPDIILLSIDGWRWDHSSMSNSGLDLTPRIHTHSRRAAVYERAYVLAPSTRQSFRALFSGLIPGRVDAPPAPEARWGVTLADGQPTLAGYLAAAGYETIAFVSDPGAFPVEEHGLDGFSEIDDSFAEFRRRHRYTASYKISHMIARLARPPSPGEPPRFLWTHLNEPHFPFITGPELPSATRLPYHERHNHSVRYVDQQVDRLLDFLAGRERKDNTWVFITSDHGEQFDEHGMRRHGSSVYEEEIRVPLLVWGPGVSPGHRTAPVSLIDLLPTIIGAAGLTPPTGVCGDSLLGNLTAGGEPPRKPVYAAALPDETTDWFSLGFIDGDRKLVIEGHTGAIEYFDLSEDPEEKNNLRREDPTAGDDLLARFRAFYVEHGMDPALYSLGAPEDEGD